MNFYFTGGCTAGAPGQCTSASNCPGAYTGGNSASGRPVTCSGANTGVSQVCDIWRPEKTDLSDRHHLLLRPLGQRDPRDCGEGRGCRRPPFI